jgi:hypothetical protein
VARSNRNATRAVHGSCPAVRLQRQPGAGLHHGHHSHGTFIDAGGYRDLPTQWPEPFLGDDPAGRSRHHAGAPAAGVRSYNPRDGRDLFDADRADHAWHTGSAGYFPAVNGCRNDAIDIRGTGISGAGYLFHAWKPGDTIPGAVRTTSYLIHVGFPRLDHTGAAAARTTASAVADHCSNANTGAIDGTEPSLDIHAGRRSRDDGIDTDDVIDRDDANGGVGNHSHAICHHYDREHLTNGPARQLLYRRMQLCVRRPADQWRGFAAHDAANSGEPAARYDSARVRAAWRHQHRSGDGGYADAEHVGMRREHDDVSGDARHHGTGQRHGRRGNAGRIAAGLLTGRKRRLEPRRF